MILAQFTPYTSRLPEETALTSSHYGVIALIVSLLGLLIPWVYRFIKEKSPQYRQEQNNLFSHLFYASDLEKSVYFLESLLKQALMTLISFLWLMTWIFLALVPSIFAINAYLGLVMITLTFIHFLSHLFSFDKKRREYYKKYFSPLPPKNMPTTPKPKP